jgi:RNA polymerase sigma factor (sigma-70 family)
MAAQAGPLRDDFALLSRFLASGDAAAFESLVARHGPMVLGVCRRVLGNWHDAEDAFQATFLVLAQKAVSIRPSGCLAGWLHGVAYHVALGARTAARRRRRQQLAPDLVPADPRPDPLADLSAREALQILEEEVQRLPAAYRVPMVLCCLQGLTQEEAARQLGCTPGSVKARLERGRQRLQRRLAGRGLTLAAALPLVEVARAGGGPDAALVAATASAAAAVAAGTAAKTGVVSAEIAALARRGLRHLAPAKAKLGLMLLLTVGLLAATLTALGHDAPPGAPPAPGASVPGTEQLKSPEGKRTRLDRAGDPLPAGAIARHGSVRLVHGGSVLGLAFSPSGTVVASCGGDNRGEDRAIHLWDVATGKEIDTFRGDNHLHHLQFSPDGKLLASAGWESPVRLWDVATGKDRCLTKDKGKVVYDLVFSSDGSLLAAVSLEQEGHSVSVWDTATGKELRTWKGPEREMWSAAFSADGATLATAGPEEVLHLWDVATGTERRRIQVDKAQRYVRPLTFAPEGNLVALANDDSTIRLWDASTGRELPPLRGHKGHIWRLAFAEGGKKLWSASKDRTIRLWDLATARELQVQSIAGEIWDCCCMDFSPDRKFLGLGGTCNTIRLFDCATGKPLHPHDGHNNFVEAVGFLPAGDLVASVGGERIVRLAEAATGKERQRSPSRPGVTISMVLSQEHGQYLALTPVALSRDSSLVAVPGRPKDSETTVGIWETGSDREVGSFTGGDIGSILHLAFAPDNKMLALACWDKTIRVWDVAGRKEVHRFTGPTENTHAVAFSPDGTLLAAGGADQKIRIWEHATGKELYQLRHDSPIHALAFSPDSRSLAAAGGQQLGEKSGDTAVRLWELATGQERGRLGGDHHLVLALAFTPDGKMLALGSSDGSVRLWDPLAGKELGRYQGHRGVVKSVAFSGDGRRLVSGSTDTLVLMWDTADPLFFAAPPAALTKAERETLWRDLAGADARLAYRAMGRLLAQPQETVALFQTGLEPVPPVDSKQIERWVADLDAANFSVREKATVALTELGDLAEPALRRVLADRPSLELRRRAEAVLAKIAPVSAPQLRGLRAVEVLELLATAQARDLLATLARGAPEGRLTRAATAALDRLSARR